MPNESIESAPQPPPVEPATAAAACCAARDESSASFCALCSKPICKNCRGVVNGRTVCSDCRGRILTELQAEQAAPASLVPAVLGGVVGAILCGIAWAMMVIVTNFEIGFAAVGVGLVTGKGVVIGSGGRKGSKLQWLAVACSILGLLVGKYLIVVHAIQTQVEGAKGLSYLDPRFLKIFVEVLPKVLSPFDALWVFIALRIAWRIPRATRVVVA